MTGQALLDELLRLALTRGYAIRRESMSRGVGAGGFAVLRGTPTVFVDERASVDAQIEVLSTVLRRLDWSSTYVSPAVRAMLGSRETNAAA